MTLEEKKARLVELKAKLAQKKESASIDAERGGLQAAAERLMVDDPIAAFGLLDKSRALDIREQQAAKDARYDPDSVRFKLASRSNAISGQLAGMPANNPAYQPLLDEQNRIKLELAKDNPSIQAVYAGETPAEIIDPGKVTGTATYDSIQADIKAATKGTYEAVKSKVATDKGVAKLSPEQEKRVDELLAQKRKELFPGANVESKDEYNIWKEGFDKSGQMKSIASGIGLGQAMSTALKSYKPGEILSQGDAQKLAAMMYVTYNPGTLQAGEMSSAITAAQGASYSTAAFNLLKSKIGITGIDKVPIEKALVGYNAALEQGGTAWKELQGNLEGRRKGGKQLKFTDLFLGSFRDPVSYKILGKNTDMNDGNALIRNAGAMPKASDYPGDFEAYKKAKAAWNAKQKAKGGK